MVKQNWFGTVEYITYWLLSSIGLAAVCVVLRLVIVLLFHTLVSHPNVNIGSWNSYTTPRFGSFMGLILGIVWLGGVAYYEHHLRTSRNQERLRSRFFKIMIWLVGLFVGLCLFLLGLSWLV